MVQHRVAFPYLRGTGQDRRVHNTKATMSTRWHTDPKKMSGGNEPVKMWPLRLSGTVVDKKKRELNICICVVLCVCVRNLLFWGIRGDGRKRAVKRLG